MLLTIIRKLQHVYVLSKRCPDRPMYKYTAKLLLISMIFSLSFSCASAPPSRIAVKKDQLANCNAVALNVSSSELDVKYSRQTGMSGITAVTGLISGLIGILPFIAAITIEATTDSLKDHSRAEAVRKGLDKSYFENKLGAYFVDHIRKANSFKINYSDQTNYIALRDKGYNASIELNIDELSLKRVGVTDKLSIYVHVLGKMIDLQTESVMWSQQEVFVGNEGHTLDEYKADGATILMNLLDDAFKKMAYRLACNIIYSQ